LPEASGPIDLSTISLIDSSNPPGVTGSHRNHIHKDAKSLIDFCKLLVPEDMIDRICAHINDYAEY
jgi:hypothetical protein